MRLSLRTTSFPLRICPGSMSGCRLTRILRPLEKTSTVPSSLTPRNVPYAAGGWVSFSTSSRRAASCSLACWRVKVSFSFCDVGLRQLALRLEQPLLEGLDPAGALLEPPTERVDLILGVCQLGAQSPRAWAAASSGVASHRMSP